MAKLCAQYLNFKCFGTLHNADVQGFVAAGAYAFQEYATLNWIYHTQLIFERESSHDGREISALMNSCLSLSSIHRGRLSEQRRELSLENTGQENQDFRSEMSLLQKTYEGTHSISDNGQSEGLSSVRAV